MSQAKAVLFDLDGTLVDSARGIHAALDGVLLEHTGRGCSLDDVRRWVGNGPVKLVERGLSRNGFTGDESRAHLSFQAAYHRTLYQADVYPGVLQGLARLEQEGMQIACVTNKSSRFTGEFLTELGLAPFFRRVLCGDEVESPKPHPESLARICTEFGVEPCQAIMVGDSANDLQPAQAIGMPAIAVSYGYHCGVSLASFNPIAIVDDFDSVIACCLKDIASSQG